MTEPKKARPEFRNLNLFKDVVTYRLPLAGWNSILHRVSGALLVLLLPLVIWLFDKSVTSQVSFEQFSAAFNSGAGWFLKLVVWGLLTAYFYHFFAGIRHLYLDLTHKMTIPFGRQSALAVFIATGVVSLICAAKLIGIF